ncbi:MAG: T9SS type A sorting domain-containing protein [Bacteroidetes bacterium]|nr:T9SS type A sorting domain-containing protein [Bacteroidota bacterium]
MREDTSLRQVFYRPANTYCGHSNFLFADFSLHQGDTTRLQYITTGNFTNCDSNIFVVDSIGYSVIFGDTVQTWYLKNTDHYLQSVDPDVSLYEGIGYSFGFSLIYSLGDGAGYGDWLVDYCTDSVCWDPCRPTGITEVEPDRGTVILSPNPASDLIHLYAPYTEILNTVMTDAEGRIVIETSLQDINVSILPTGVYSLSIFTKAGIVRHRFTKI